MNNCSPNMLSASLRVIALGLVVGAGAFGCAVDPGEVESSGDEAVGVATEALALPNLTVQTITRDTHYYYVKYCNVGTTTSASPFLVKLTNTNTNQSFTSNSYYPFSVPAPGTCATTGGFTCGLIGDPSCNTCMSVKATVDSANTVTEANESNNDLTTNIGCPDLTVQTITRNANYYYVKYCNVGTTTSASPFLVKLTNANTNQSFTSNSYYPFSVPAPGACATTGGFTCGLIGDPSCSLHIPVIGFVDSNNTVLESNELNNTLSVSF